MLPFVYDKFVYPRDIIASWVIPSSRVGYIVIIREGKIEE